MRRTAEMILGIVGGIFGIFGGIFAIVVGGLGQAPDAAGVSQVTRLGMLAILLGIIGIIGGAIVNRNRRVAAYLMLASGVLGFLTVSTFWIIAGIMLSAGGILVHRES